MPFDDFGFIRQTTVRERAAGVSPFDSDYEAARKLLDWDSGVRPRPPVGPPGKLTPDPQYVLENIKEHGLDLWRMILIIFTGRYKEEKPSVMGRLKVLVLFPLGVLYFSYDIAKRSLLQVWRMITIGFVYILIALIALVGVGYGYSAISSGLGQIGISTAPFEFYSLKVFCSAGEMIGHKPNACPSGADWEKVKQVWLAPNRKAQK